MSAPEYARLAAKVLAEGARSMPTPAPSAEVRSQAIAAVEHAIAGRAHSRRVRRWTMAFASVAAVLVVASLYLTRHKADRSGLAATTHAATPDGVQIVARAVGGGASVLTSGAQTPLADGRALSIGSRIVTPRTGSATLAFSTGTSVVLREGSDMTVGGDGLSQRLGLRAGALDLHVAKLAPDQQFVVETPDAEVEVRGTRFVVSIVSPDPSCGDATVTRVGVMEGVVVVRHKSVEARVSANQEWPPGGCGRPTAPAAPSVALNAQVATAAVGPPSVRSAPMPSTASTLGEQNDMFAEAVAAKHRGDPRGAVAGFERFLAQYPSSPLVESATVERIRALRMTDPPRAVAAAKQYLARYPSGFAHGEAEAIVAGAP